MEMKAVIIKAFGGAENLNIGNWEKPMPKANEILVRVRATALNRADILQREGTYPPPAGASPILGLEIAGEIAEIGEGVSRWKVGERVFGLISGGGYAQYATIHEAMALPIPPKMSFHTAAAIPEAFLTAYQALVWLAKLKANEKILIHAGASGVGTAAIQIAQEVGAEVLVTASALKHELCLALGAKKTIDYQSQDFHEQIMQYTDKQGVNVVLDFLAASYFQRNIDSLALDGRLVILGWLGGVEVAQFNMTRILAKRLTIMGSTLRSRTSDYQINLTRDLWSFASDRFANGKLKPVIDSIFDWKDVQKAHLYMQANKNAGKIVLEIN